MKKVLTAYKDIQRKHDSLKEEYEITSLLLEKLVQERLSKLLTVGRSVARKQYGRNLETPSEYGEGFEWLSSKSKVVEFNPEHIILAADVTKIGNKVVGMPYPGEVKVPLSVLTLSDRDFAKQVRHAIYLRQEEMDKANGGEALKREAHRVQDRLTRTQKRLRSELLNNKQDNPLLPT